MALPQVKAHLRKVRRLKPSDKAGRALRCAAPPAASGVAARRREGGAPRRPDIMGLAALAPPANSRWDVESLMRGYIGATYSERTPGRCRLYEASLFRRGGSTQRPRLWRCIKNEMRSAGPRRRSHSMRFYGNFLYSCNNRTGRCTIATRTSGMKNLQTRNWRFSFKTNDWPWQNHS